MTEPLRYAPPQEAYSQEAPSQEAPSQEAPLELGTKSVPSLLFQYALPAIVAMAATSLLNIVDRIYIGQGVGPLAISGLASTFPFMNLGAAFGAMVGVGSGAVISIRLGQGKYDMACQVLGNTLTLNLVVGLLFALVCWIFLDPMLMLFGASQNTIPYARDYMQVLLLGNVLSHSYLGFNNVLRSSGHPRKAMMCTIVAVLINCILDPVFIYALHWGIRGAALATVIAQTVSLVWQLFILSDKTHVVHLRRGTLRMRLHIVWQIVAIGMSPFLMNACACVVVILINHGMRKYGDLLMPGGGDIAVGAYGIDNTIIFFFLMIVMGINQGMQPIAGYNWGARLNARVWQVMRYAIMAATVITTAGFLLGELIPEFVVSLFTTDKDIIAIAARGFRIDVMVFPLVGTQMVISNLFQNIGHAGKSIILSLTRQALFLIPGLYLLPLAWGLDGVWAAMPMADGVSFLLAVVMLAWLVSYVKRQTHRPSTR